MTSVLPVEAVYCLLLRQTEQTTKQALAHASIHSQCDSHHSVLIISARNIASLADTAHLDKRENTDVANCKYVSDEITAE